MAQLRTEKHIPPLNKSLQVKLNLAKAIAKCALFTNLLRFRAAIWSAEHPKPTLMDGLQRTLA
jgi:hypothetical protein